MIEKFLNKDNIIIVIVSFIMVVGFIYNANYFATKMDILALKNELLQQKLELQKYSDEKDEKILVEIDAKYEKIMQKLDSIKR